MELYLFKSALCLAIFFVFYKALLETSSLHRLKRFYLLGALLCSFSIPFITFTSYVEIATVDSAASTAFLDNAVTEQLSINYLPIALWSIYGLGVLYFGLQFIKNLVAMAIKIRSNPKFKSSSVINVLLQEQVVPHTFFNYIFLNKLRFESNSIPKEVLAHEITHAREKHSIDILIIELLGVVFWFNPLFYFLRKAMRLNHEFLADRSVLNKGADLTTYQNIVLAFSSNAQSPILANSINYSFIKKRFTVMKTNTSKRMAWLKSLLLLPLLATVLFSFSSREIIQVDSPLAQEQYDVQQSATREEMKEYQALAKKYNAMDMEKLIIKKKDLVRMEYIYHKMSPKQKADAEPFPNIPPPPPPPAPDAPGAPKVIKGVNDVNATIPPPPPPPPAPESPLDHIIAMAKKGAIFYYEGKKISSDEAIALIKKNEHLNIDSRGSGSENPIIRISTKGFKHD